MGYIPEDSDKSIFISPFSISAALTMTYNGAGTTTKEAMDKALGYDGIDKDTVNDGYKNLFSHLENVDKKVELDIENSICTYLTMRSIKYKRPVKEFG